MPCTKYTHSRPNREDDNLEELPKEEAEKKGKITITEENQEKEIRRLEKAIVEESNERKRLKKERKI